MPEAPLALSTGDVFLIVVLIAIPFVVVSFATGSTRALGEIGKGPLAIDHDMPDEEESMAAPIREAEVRQMVEAKAYRQQARGEEPLDVDAETKRLMESPPPSPLGHDAGLREEVRQLVVASNERRERKGEDPLDVDAEVERRLRELEDIQ